MDIAQVVFVVELDILGLEVDALHIGLRDHEEVEPEGKDAY